MKTADQLKKEMETKLAKFEAEMQELKNQIDEVENFKLPDYVVNFNPFNIKNVIVFFESNPELLVPTRKYFDDYEFTTGNVKVIKFDKYTIETVDQEGGCEGSGEHWHCVFKVSVDGEIDRYYYIPGYYASYVGTTIEWNSIYEVTPVDKVVIDWKKK